MNQNSIIAFALLVGFVVFVTMKGELSQYLAVIGLSNVSLPGNTGTVSATPGTLPLSNIPGQLSNSVPTVSQLPLGAGFP